MKTPTRLPFSLGLVLGFLAAIALLQLAPLSAQEAKKEALTQEELDKKLDDVLDAQKKILERLATVTTQSQFLKAASGK